MSLHMFVDESKARSFILVGTMCPDAALNPLRKGLTKLLLPGQERLHFTKERDSRRREILTHILTSPLSTVVVETTKRPSEIEARARALRRLVREAATRSVGHITIERDLSMLAIDQKIMAEMAWFERRDFPVTYSWARPHQEPLLWAADALAWCWAAGGSWKQQIREKVKSVSASLP